MSSVWRHMVSVTTLLVFLVLAAGSTDGSDDSTPTVARHEDAANLAAAQEFREMEWVRDVYVSPGHMNLGVLPEEKDWKAPMIATWVCGILTKHGSDLPWVRFVDIRAVASQGKTVRGAEIHKVTCH